MYILAIFFFYFLADLSYKTQAEEVLKNKSETLAE